MTRPHEEAELLARLAASIQDLDAYFGELDAATGFKAQSYDGVGSVVFDDRRSWELHAAKHHPAHRSAVQRQTRIRQGLLELSADDRATCALGFTPRQFAWTDLRSSHQRKRDGQRSGIEAKVREAFHFGARTGACLLGLALESEDARAAFLGHQAARAVGIVSPTYQNLFRFIEWEVERPNSHVIKALRDAMSARLLEAIGRYDAVRMTAVEIEAAARARALDRLARLHSSTAT